MSDSKPDDIPSRDEPESTLPADSGWQDDPTVSTGGHHDEGPPSNQETRTSNYGNDGAEDEENAGQSGDGSGNTNRNAAGGFEYETDDEPNPTIEGYKIISHLGEGGMGTVFKAIQLGTRREVALKLMSARTLGSDKAKRRFEREVELASSLNHPNIAQVYDTGLHKGVYFYAMPLVDGMQLDQHVRKKKLTANAIITLMEQVCQAVDFAHRRGVIHRDLKPSNIMVENDGRPVVLDFGLAKSLVGDHESLNVSMEGDLAGTPAYMSPEQAAGKISEIDTRSDVYALGVILYRLLTGESPHEMSGSPYTVMKKIVEEEPRNPRTFTPDLDRDLEAILFKCLAKDPGDRYGSAGAVAGDLQAYLQGDPIIAQPATITYFLRKRLARHKPAVAGILLALVAVVGAVTFYIVSINAERTRTATAKSKAESNAAIAIANAEKADASAKEADANAKKAEENAKEAAANAAAAQQATDLAQQRERVNRAQLVRIYVERGWELMDKGDAAGALLLHSEAYRLDADAAKAMADNATTNTSTSTGTRSQSNAQPPIDLSGHRFRYSQLIGLMDAVPVVVSHKGAVSKAKFQPGSLRFVTASDDGTARVWDTKTGKPTSAIMTHEDSINNVEFSRDGKRIATAGKDGDARVWDAATGQAITPPLKHRSGERRWAVFFAAFNADGTQVITGSEDGNLRIWNATTGELLKEPFYPCGHRAALINAQFSPDGSQFFTLDTRSLMRTFDAKTYEPISPPFSIKEISTYSTYSPDGSKIIAMGIYGIAQQWDSKTGKAIGDEIQQPPFKKRGISYASYRPDGKQIATSGTSDSCIRFWDEMGKPQPKLTIKLTAPARHVEYDRTGRYVVVSAEDGTVRAYAILNDSVRPTSPIYKHGGSVEWATFSEDKDRILTACTDGTARVFMQTKQAAVSARLDHPKGVSSASFSPDGKWLATGGPGMTVWLWDMTTGRRLPGELTRPGTIHYVEFRRDSQQVLVTHGKPNFRGGTHSLWTRSKDGEWVDLPLEGGINDVARYIHGNRVLTTNRNQCTTWDANTGKKIATFPIKIETFVRTDVDSTQKFIITAHGKTATVWNTTNGETLATLKHDVDVKDVAFSPDGRFVATAAQNAQVQIWNATTGEPTTPPMIHPVTRGGGITKLTFSPDNQRLATGNYSGDVRVWNAATGQPITSPMSAGGPVIDVEFTHDSHMVIGLTLDGWARTFEATTGLIASPKMWYLRTFHSPSLVLTPSGDQVLMVSGSYQSTLWNLSNTIANDWPPEDAIAVAQALSHRKVDSTGTMVSLSHEESQALRETYAKKYPELFETIPTTPKN